ncbi:MAG TPA: iron dicitrate transport regulator FecR, partial [Parasegetibacter sp.]
MPVINEKIADLLIRHLEGELNLHEQAQLREWLDDSPLHEQIAKEFMEEENLQANLSALVSKEKSWEKFLQSVPLTQRVQSDPQVIKLKSLRKLFGWTAAAASVVLLVSLAIYFFNANRESASFVMEHTQGNNDIEPGHDGAILTLADGSQIVLDSVANGVIALQNGSQVVLENGRLTYGTAGKAADEIVYNTVTTPKGRQFSLLLP